jgi:hypothetical protein
MSGIHIEVHRFYYSLAIVTFILLLSLISIPTVHCTDITTSVAITEDGKYWIAGAGNRVCYNTAYSDGCQTMNDNVTSVAITQDGKYWIAAAGTQICYNTAYSDGCQ